MKHLRNDSKNAINRRSFIKTGVTAGAVATGIGLLGNGESAFAKAQDTSNHRIDRGDAAILRFLAAAEILETDLWQQYNELGGIQDSEVPGGGGSADYTKALGVLDEDMNQYIHDNTEDELTHELFINAYLVSKGEEPINLDAFRTLPSSKATGAQQIGRLTNLMQLTVDTTWFTRYRSRTQNPDFGDVLPQAIPALAVGQHTAIPRTDADLQSNDFLQAIANTAGFHFATIEQGGTSLYSPEGDQRGSAAHPACNRRNRDHAFPDLVRQSGKCTSIAQRRGSGDWSGGNVPRLKFSSAGWRRFSNEPDHARANRVP
jgi:hypothetical protein